MACLFYAFLNIISIHAHNTAFPDSPVQPLQAGGLTESLNKRPGLILIVIKHLTNDEVIAINNEVLSSIKAKRADSFKVLSHSKLNAVLEKATEDPGDAYDKAVALLKGISQEHPFASGNRRTAMLAAIRFLRMNGEEAVVKGDAKILQGVRESYYSDSEIKQWLKGGDMREFKR